MNRWPKPQAQSALGLNVPAAEKIVGRFRAKHDPAAAEGVPAHFTILYPFVPPDQIDGAVRGRLASCLGRIEPFEFQLTAIRRFPEAIYLAPEPAEPLKQLILAICQSFPNYPPYDGKFEEVIPHLTVAQEKDQRLLGDLEQEFEQAARPHLPLSVRASEIALMDNTDGLWKMAASFPLGRT